MLRRARELLVEERDTYLISGSGRRECVNEEERTKR